MQAMVTNQSTQNGVPVAATLTVVINSQEQVVQFAAGEAVVIPLSASGTIQVKSPGGIILATQSFTVSLYYIYMTFRDSTGVEREFNMTTQAAAYGMTVEQLKQAYINAGYIFVSQRTGP